MKIDPSLTVGQIAVALKESIPVFEKHKIDYFSQGGLSLREACYLAGVPPEEVRAALEDVVPSAREWYAERDWAREPMAELADYLVRTHHAYTRRQLDLLEKMLEQSMVSGNQGPEGEWLQRLFLRFSHDFRNHMLDEEEVVFPYLREVEMALHRGNPVPRPFQGYTPATHPLRILMTDHGMMGREWRKMEELTRGFTPSPGASRELRDLYRLFRELQQDNQKHIHLENNILFQRAEQLGLLNDEGQNAAGGQKTATFQKP